MNVHTSAPDPDDSAPTRLERRALWLARLTVGWNVVEAAVAVTFGVLAASPSLLGFGIDSVVESGSGVVMLWRFGRPGGGAGREAAAERAVGVCLLALAVFVAWDAGTALHEREAPDASWVGIVLAATSAVVMPVLAAAKRRVAAKIGSASLRADSRQTDICFYLSLLLLVGVGCNALFGWWWVDPAAALAMVPLITWEGLGALRGKGCGCG